MDYIVLDLEWNQAADLSARQESGLSFEIIEIGAVKLDCDKNLIGSFHELIKPQVFHKMNEVTKEIIHINMKQLKGGRNFANVNGKLSEMVRRRLYFLHLGEHRPY